MFRRSRKPAARPYVGNRLAYLDWNDDEQDDVRWTIGLVSDGDLVSETCPVRGGMRINALRVSTDVARELSCTRTGNVIVVTHPQINPLASTIFSDLTRLQELAKQASLVNPTVIIAPRALVALASEENARRLAAELNVAYAMRHLNDCVFDWKTP